MRSFALCISGSVSSERLVAVREKAVGDQLGEGGAEVARVGVAGQQHRDRAGARVDARRASRSIAPISSLCAGDA